MNMNGQILDSLQEKITKTLSPSYLSIINESSQHHGDEYAETHFKITVVSPQFSELSLVKRHQKVYALVGDAMDNGLHALSLHTYSPEEWDKKQHIPAPDSPACRGGLIQEIKKINTIK